MLGVFKKEEHFLYTPVERIQGEGRNVFGVILYDNSEDFFKNPRKQYSNTTYCDRVWTRRNTTQKEENAFYFCWALGVG